MSQNLLPLMKYTINELNKASIPFFLDYGTLLAAIRNGALIPWEFDVDLSVNEEYCDQIFAEMHAKFKKEKNYNMFTRKQWIPEKFNPVLGSDGYLNKPCVRVYDDKMQYYVDIDWQTRILAEEVEMYSKKLYLTEDYDPNKGDDVWCNLEGFDNGDPGGCRADSALFPLRTMQFHGITVNVPQNSELVLFWLYGPNWRIPKAKGYKFLCFILPSHHVLWWILFLSVVVLIFFVLLSRSSYSSSYRLRNKHVEFVAVPTILPDSLL
jgi:hypothetical protein